MEIFPCFFQVGISLVKVPRHMLSLVNVSNDAIVDWPVVTSHTSKLRGGTNCFHLLAKEGSTMVSHMHIEYQSTSINVALNLLLTAEGLLAVLFLTGEGAGVEVMVFEVKLKSLSCCWTCWAEPVSP